MHKSIKIFLVPGIIFCQIFISKSVKGSVSVGANVGLSNLLFKASSKAPNVPHSYPSYIDGYKYQYPGQGLGLDTLETEDAEVPQYDDQYGVIFDVDRQVAGDNLIVDDYDRQVEGEQFLVDDQILTPGLEGLSPLLLTSALVIGLSAVFANVINLDSTASNVTVPFGLLALPGLGDCHPSI